MLFTAGAAHDLQGPVRKIMALVSRHLQLPGRKPDVYRDMARIRDLASGMRDMLHYLQAYEQAKSAPLDLQQIEGEDAVSEVLIDLRPKILSARARIAVGALPAVVADPIQLRQVLHHLIDNAIKFRRPGVPPNIEVGGRVRSDGRVDLWVEDDGIGIEPRHFDQIFEPFKRLNCPDAYEGNGLGLAVCRRIMDRHGGQIHVRSTPDAGSRFTLTFPERPR